MLPDCEGPDEDVVLKHVAGHARHRLRRHLHAVHESTSGLQLEVQGATFRLESCRALKIL